MNAAAGGGGAVSSLSPMGSRRPPPAPSSPRPRSGTLTRVRMADLKALGDKRKRLALGKYLVEGFHIVEEALLTGAPVEEVFLGEGAALSHVGRRIVERAGKAGIPVTEVPRRVVDALADAETPQGVLAVVRMTDREAGLPFDRDGVAVVLDGIQDPGNAGAIVRAADAFGCASVVFGRGTVEPVNPKVLRAAQGSHFHLPVTAGPHASEAAVEAKRLGHRVYAAVSSGGRSLYELRDGGPRITVVLGNETRGVAAEVLEHCDGRLTIPLRGRAESLGVAAAAAVVLAWFARGDGAP